MAYSCTFGVTSKRVNSTSRAYTPLAAATCALKSPCDLYNPTLTFQGSFPENANYMYITELDKYYWITSITFNIGLWEITGKLDVMATYKGQIGSQVQLITRSSSNYNRRFNDSLAVAYAIPDVWTWNDNIGFSAIGCYVVCCAGTNSNKFYIMSRGQWEILYGLVFTSGFLQEYKNVWNSLVQDFVNTVLKPADYIISAIWLPVPIPGGLVAEEIVLGFTRTGIAARVVAPETPLFVRNIDIDVPLHPDADAYGEFLNGNAYRKITLTLPGYGTLTLDADALASSNHVQVIAAMDVSGNITYSIRERSTNIIYSTVSANMAVDAGFSVSKSNISNAIAGVTGAVASASYGNIGGAVSGAVNAISTCMPSIERASSGGSRSVLLAGADMVGLSCKFYRIHTIPRQTIGGACLLQVKPEDLTGYIQCEHASVAAPATQSELEEINAYMNGGFYYE